MACFYAYIVSAGQSYFYTDCCGRLIQGTTTTAFQGFPNGVDFSKPFSSNLISADTLTPPCPSPSPTPTKTVTPTPTPTKNATPTPTRTPTQTPSRSGLPNPVNFQVFNECDVYVNYPLVLTCNLIKPASYLNNDGELEVKIAGGTAPYVITWSNGSTQRVITNLSGGFYTVQVVDSYGDYTATTTCEVPRILPPCEIAGSATPLSPSKMFAIVLNNTRGIGKKVNTLSYSSITNPTIGYSYPNTNVALASSPLGYSASTNLAPYVPSYGDTVQMQIPEIPVSPANLEFDPTLGGKMWFYTSNTEYTASEFITTVIPSMSAITVSAKTINSIDNYVGRFQYNYIGSPSFYYMVWDYRDYPDLKEFKVFANNLTSFTANTIQSVFLGSTPFPFWVDFGNGNKKYFSGGTYTNFTTGYTSPFTGEINFYSTNLSAITQINISGNKVVSNPSNIYGLTFSASELGKLSGLTSLILGSPTDGLPLDVMPHLSGNPSELPRNITTFIAANTSLTGNISGFSTSITNFRLGTNNLTGNMQNFNSNILSVFQILGSNTISGDVADIPPGTKILDITGDNTLSGDTSDLPNNAVYIHIFGNNTLSGDTSGFPATIGTQAGLEELAVTGYNTVSGDVSNLPPLTKILEITGNNSITGNTNGLPTNLTSVNLSCSNTFPNCDCSLYGDVVDLPSNLTRFIHINTGTTVSGDTSDIPSNMTIFVIQGKNEIGGDLADLPSNLNTIVIKGLNKINNYTYPHIWPEPMNHLDISGDYTGLTTTIIDNILIDLSPRTWVNKTLGGGQTYTPFIGLKALTPYTPTGAALTAYNTLIGKNVVIQIS